MTRDEIVEKLNKRMKTLNRNLVVKCEKNEELNEYYLNLYCDNEIQGWFINLDKYEFVVNDEEYLTSYIKHSETLVQFFVYGQKLLEELDE